MRFFNTAGPCDPRFHYMLPAAERLPGVPRLVERGMYFVVNAPRQTGKTTTLKALASKLTGQGHFAALRFSCETAKTAGDDIVAGQRAVLRAIGQRAHAELPAELRPPPVWPALNDADANAHLLSDSLSAWAQECPRPLVLFFDEIDALQGDSLLSVLAQLRDSYDMRPDRAPWSIALCGLRDIRGYQTASGSSEELRIGSASPFHIKVESMRLDDFTRAQVATLYQQHTQASGQAFTDDAVDRAFALTCGQPWLVNALAHEIIDNMAIAPPEPIAVAHVEEAKERLIQTRATHLDSLVARLAEPRVKAIVEPLLAGTYAGGGSYDDDFAYVRDLGLIAADSPTRPANPIYREVIVRTLAAGVEKRLIDTPRRFVGADGRLDMHVLLDEFAGFWREHGEILTAGLIYHEVAPQLVLMAFLQRVVNGGGFVDREYGVGRGRIDLLLRWPWRDGEQHRRWQREALELKVWRDKQPDPLADGLAQLDAYLDRLGLDHGALVIFDRRSRAASSAQDMIDPQMTEEAMIDQPTALRQCETPSGRPVLLLRA